MNEFDDDLRRRLQSLAMAASNATPNLSLAAANSRHRVIRTRMALPIGALSVGLLLVLVALYPRFTSPGPAQNGVSPSAISPSVVGPSATSAPSGGLGYDQAVEIAREHARFSQLWSAESGPISSVYAQPAASDAIPPDRLVWVVRFSGTDVVCPPDGSSCLPGRTGLETIVIDYFTGELLGYSLGS